MREILFRGKCEDGYDYSNGDGWVYGSLLQDEKVAAIVRTEDIELCFGSDDGVTLIEVTDEQPRDGRPALNAQNNQKVYPLGGWCVIKPEAFSHLTNQQWSAGQKCFVDSQVLQMITGGVQS